MRLGGWWRPPRLLSVGACHLGQHRSAGAVTDRVDVRRVAPLLGVHGDVAALVGDPGRIQSEFAGCAGSGGEHCGDPAADRWQDVVLRPHDGHCRAESVINDGPLGADGPAVDGDKPVRQLLQCERSKRKRCSEDRPCHGCTSRLGAQPVFAQPNQTCLKFLRLRIIVSGLRHLVRLSVKIVIAGDNARSLSEEVITVASCNCQCAWCKEARANKYSTHSCSQIPKCSGSK